MISFLHITCYLDTSLLKTAMSEFHIVIPNVISVSMPSNYFSHSFILKLRFFCCDMKVSISTGLGLIGKNISLKFWMYATVHLNFSCFFSFDCHDLFSSLTENRFFLTSYILTTVYPPSTPLTSSPPPFPFGPTSFCFSIENNQVAMTYSVY